MKMAILLVGEKPRIVTEEVTEAESIAQAIGTADYFVDLEVSKIVERMIRNNIAYSKNFPKALKAWEETKNKLEDRRDK